MERLVAFGAVLTFVSFYSTSAQQSFGSVIVDNGGIGVGVISGASFGPGSFSINGSPSGRPKTQVYVQEDDGGTHHIVTQSGSTEPDNSGGGNTQLYPVQPLTKHTNSGQGSNEGGSGQIIIGSVVLNKPKNKHNSGNNPENDTIQPNELDAAALVAIFGSNHGSNGPPSTGNGHSNSGEQGSIQIVSISGGNFKEGTLSINNNNKRPVTDMPQNGSAVNNGNSGNLNAENEAQDSVGHGGNIQPDTLDAAAIEAIFGSNGGNNGVTITQNGLSNTGEQGSIQIASITGGNFEKGTLNINNKKPGTNVPQYGREINHGNTKNLNAENEAQDSIGHGANNNDAGTVGVGSNHGQKSSGNSGGNDEPWIWNR